MSFGELQEKRIDRYELVQGKAADGNVDSYLVARSLRGKQQESKTKKQTDQTHPEGLFLSFALIDQSIESVVKFVSEYGLLQANNKVAVELPYADYDRTITEGEALGDWFEAIDSMRSAVKLWRSIKPSALDLINWGCELPAIQPGNEEVEVREGYRLLSDTIERNLTGQVRPGVTVDNDTCRPILQWVPVNLYGRLWLQLAQAISDDKHYRSCIICANWFELHKEQSRWDRQYCSNSCRQKLIRRKKLDAQNMHEEHMPYAVIAAQLGVDIDTIYRWLEVRR